MIVKVESGSQGCYADLAVEIPDTHAGYAAVVKHALAKLVESPARAELLRKDPSGPALLAAIVAVVKDGQRVTSEHELLRAAAKRVQEGR